MILKADENEFAAPKIVITLDERSDELGTHVMSMPSRI